MEGRRRNNHRRSQNRKPPLGSWQPTVPAWEKEFCRVIGSMDWETLVQTKKFTHLYDNVIKWNDSAGEEAFSNAKRRFWAEKNTISCDISLPDPDLYIDKIKWDSEADPDLLSEVGSLPPSPKTEGDHDDPVVNQDFAPTGWGEEGGDLLAAAEVTRPSANDIDPWGYSRNEWAVATWPGYSGDAWGCNNGGGHGCMPWEGDWSNWNWNNANDCGYAAPDVRDTWHDYCNVSSFATTRARASQQRRKHVPRNGKGHDKTPYKRSSDREWNSSSIAVGPTWDQE